MGRTLRSCLAVAGWVGLVALTGCGGGSGGEEAAAPAPSPAPATVRPPVIDSARAGSASIGAAGGTVRATAANGVEYTLTVPPRALKQTISIRMTPITDLGSAPLAAGLSGAVQLEPSGLRFLLPATLRIGTLPTLSAGRRLYGFGSANDGTGTQFKLPTVRNGGIEVMVAHFSNAGAAEATPAEAAQGLAPNQDPGESDFWVREIMLGDRLAATVGENFLSWFNGVVSPRLAAAVAGTDDAILEALGAYETWIDAIATVPGTFNYSPAAEAQMLALVTAQVDRAKVLMADILRARLDADLAACPGNPGTGLVESASLMQQLAARNGLDTAQRGLDRASFLRKVNACLRPVLDPARLPDALSVGQPQSLDLRAQLVLNGQPNPVAAPFQFTVTPTGAAVATPVGFSDIAGRFTTVFTPSVTTPTFIVRACLVLNDANGTTGSDICVSQQVTSALVVLAGSIASSVDSPSDGLASGERNVERTFGTVRLSVDAAGVVRVLQASASFEASGVATISSCFDPELNRFRQRDMRFTSTGVGDWTAIFGPGSILTESAIGGANIDSGGFSIGFSGLRVDTAEEFVDSNTSCAVKLVAAPPRSAGGGGRVRVIARDTAGRITAVDLTETFTTRQGAVIFRSIGQLVAE